MIKNILITGGLGFVGSALTKKLSENKNNNILVVDNLLSGDLKNKVKELNVSYEICHTKDIFSLYDINNYPVPDVVFHFGEYARINPSFEEVDIVVDSNVNGTYQVIEFCRKNNCKLIYSASSTKFSNTDDSPYSFFKSQNVDLIKNYGEWYGLDYAICYFYNVYGNGQISRGKYSTVIGIFEECYKNNKRMPVVLPGTQGRDFTHIDDIVSGLLRMLEKDASGDGFCFGTGIAYSVEDVARMFSDKIEYLPERKGDRKTTSIDLSKSKNELNWFSVNDIKDYVRTFKDSVVKNENKI